MSRPKHKTTIQPLTVLGQGSLPIPASPQQARLEAFPNPSPARSYRITFETSEFTSLCPITLQPDFATLTIEYVPKSSCVESKSLKLYLASFRNQGSFAEAIVNRILDDLVACCHPAQATVTGRFSARGGISIVVKAEYPCKKT